MTQGIRIIGLSKVFAGPNSVGPVVHAVNRVDLEIEAGKLVTLLGPSGCGKTTLLRMIAGFEEPTEGEMFFGDRRINEIPPNRRDAAMVFQSYAIFPHLDVFENVAFGLRLKKMPRGEITERVTRVLQQTGLEGYARRSPNQLSGGQQQRVALARCIVIEPKVLLFDEPLSNLDAKLREQMRIEIRELQQRLCITSIYVTHDQIEAMSISDQIVVMNHGNVEQIGAPIDIYNRPANRFVADFIGKANFVSAKVMGEGVVEVTGIQLETDTHNLDVGATMTLVVRPEAVRMSRDHGEIAAVVRRAVFLGDVVEYLVEISDGVTWLIDGPSPAEYELFEAGRNVRLSISTNSVHAIPD